MQHQSAGHAYGQKAPHHAAGGPQQKEKTRHARQQRIEGIQGRRGPGKTLAQGPEQIVPQPQTQAQQHRLNKDRQRPHPAVHPNRRPSQPPRESASSS